MRQELGKRGEDIASLHLQEQGYRILARNFRNRYGEIDIICSQEEILVFVEVKTRRGTAFGFPEESVTPVKRDQIRRLALAYIEKYAPAFEEIRFDVIGILVEGEKPNINHLIGAF